MSAGVLARLERAETLARSLAGVDRDEALAGDPVMLAVPARSFPSTSAPLRTRSSAANNGRPGRSTTTTRKPFVNFVSFGCENVTSCGAEGGGGVSTPPIANAERNETHQMTKHE